MRPPPARRKVAAVRVKVQDPVFGAVVTALVLAGTVQAWHEQPEMRTLDGLAWVLLSAGGLALVVRRILPIVCVAVTFTVSMIYLALGYPYGPIFFYVMIALYTLAAWRPIRPALIVTAVLLPLNAAQSWWFEAEPDSFTFSLFTSAIWLVAPVAVGIVVRGKREADVRAQEQLRARHVSEERLRMAREVHDAVGHSLAVISVNAGAALHVLAKLPDPPPQVGESLRAIRTASRQGLDELRATLAAQPHHGSASSLAALPELVAATNVDGLAACLTITGEPRALPSNVDVAAYRIVQEALTNVVRHAKARHTTVELSYGSEHLRLRVADDGVGGPPAPGGSGLDNMRARAAALGGSFTVNSVGSGHSGGFEVVAALPCPSEAVS